MTGTGNPIAKEVGAENPQAAVKNYLLMPDCYSIIAPFIPVFGLTIELPGVKVRMTL